MTNEQRAAWATVERFRRAGQYHRDNVCRSRGWNGCDACDVHDAELREAELEARVARGGGVSVRRVLAALALFLAMPGMARAGVYSVTVTRIDKDLYKTTEKNYIQTRYCYEYAYGDGAALRWEPYGADNKLIFDSGTSCEVVKVFK